MTICTDEFEPLARMEARALEMPRLAIVSIPHPLGGLRSEEVSGRAYAALREIEKMWKDLS